MADRIEVRPLGQSGFRLEYDGSVIYVDPYLSNSVAEREGAHLERLLPPPVAPGEVRDADWVCVTHLHLDHCDDATLGPLTAASPFSRIFGPREVVAHLRDVLALPAERSIIVEESWQTLGPRIRMRAVPVGHPHREPDSAGSPKYFGYLFEFGNRRVYHSGDCSVDDEQIALLKSLGPIDTAFLPVNECNYFRNKLGIVGNMSIREAFGLAEALNVKTLVPMHYDMFRPNRVYRTEIQAVYDGDAPPFALVFNPTSI